MNDISSYNDLFLTTAKEHINALENKFAEDNTIENMEEIFRRLHSLKGSSGAMGYKEIENTCTKMVDLIRPEQKVLLPDEQTFNTLKTFFDRLKEQLRSISSGKVGNIRE